MKDAQSATIATGERSAQSLRTLRTAFFFLMTLCCAYVSSYYALSRYCQRVHPIGREKAFLYVPLDPNKVQTSNSLIYINRLMSYFYYPIWLMDHQHFGGPNYTEI